jgi:uncharacterized membrane protein
MGNRFLREIIWTNYLFIGTLILMIIAANLYYGADEWLGSILLVAVLALALVFKIRLVKARGKNLDERVEYLTYRSLAVGFYFILAAVFWFYAKEMAVDGQVSTRTIAELLFGLAGYVGSLVYFQKRY